jgi:hypothetical protein
MLDDGETFLNDTWNLYFHDPNNENWEIESYILIARISTVQEWVSLFISMRDIWHKGMFFIMREHIQPIWEDEHNRKGGCLSYKLWKNEVTEAVFELGCKLLGETLTVKHNWEKICGVSISPKRSYCIARIWISDCQCSDESLYTIHLPPQSKFLFKSHNENKDYAVQP